MYSGIYQLRARWNSLHRVNAAQHLAVLLVTQSTTRRATSLSNASVFSVPCCPVIGDRNVFVNVNCFFGHSKWFLRGLNLRHFSQFGMLHIVFVGGAEILTKEKKKNQYTCIFNFSGSVPFFLRFWCMCVCVCVCVCV